MLRNLMFLFAISCCLSFAWAVRGHFRQQGGMPSGMRLVSALTALGFVWFLYLNFPIVRDGGVPRMESPLALTISAIVLFLASLALFWWTVSTTRRHPLTLAFASDVPAHLQVAGPYAYVRHPFYLSYILFWIATAVAANQALPWAVPLVMAGLYIAAARREERKFAASPLAAAYKDYRLRTGMLLPRLRVRSGRTP